jgi:hypothetical protein
MDSNAPTAADIAWDSASRAHKDAQSALERINALMDRVELLEQIVATSVHPRLVKIVKDEMDLKKAMKK